MAETKNAKRILLKDQGNVQFLFSSWLRRYTDRAMQTGFRRQVVNVRDEKETQTSAQRQALALTDIFLSK
jgi:hypothetical protein